MIFMIYIYIKYENVFKDIKSIINNKQHNNIYILGCN